MTDSPSSILLGLDFQVLGAAASVATAYIAWRALSSWKEQTSTKIKIEHVDELVKTTFEYLDIMRNAVEVHSTIAIGIHSYQESSFRVENKEITGIINYIQKWGETESHHLLSFLEKAKPIRSKLQLLVHKSMSMQLESHEECRKALDEMIICDHRLESVYMFLVNRSFNYDHPEVRETLLNIFSLNPKELDNCYIENCQTIFDQQRKVYSNLFM